MDNEYDISQVARLAGVTSRTLRHYDALGLLTPAWTGSDGRRHYTGVELLRLQHILVLRSLGAGLDTIARVVDTDDPAVITALMNDHLVALEREAQRFATLAATVRRTIATLHHGGIMNGNDMFDGFDHRDYEPEARERWGDARVDQSNAAWASMSEESRAATLADHGAVATEIATLAAADAPPDDPRVQAAVARHYAWVCTFWTPDAESYTALGVGYVEDHRFRATYDKFGDGTAELLRDGMAVYAARELR